MQNDEGEGGITETPVEIRVRKHTALRSYCHFLVAFGVTTLSFHASYAG